MDCPLLLSTIAIFISFPATPPTPVYTESGIENKQCAPSISPFNILSLTTAHEASFSSSTSTPYFANRPSSFAATSGAQSVSDINPSFIFLGGGGILKEVIVITNNISAVTKNEFLILSF